MRYFTFFQGQFAKAVARLPLRYLGFLVYISCVQTFTQMGLVQACEIRQQFPEIVGKIVIFRKPKTLSRFNQIASRDDVNQFFILFSPGRYPKHPLTRALRHYMAGPLLKSRRRPCGWPFRGQTRPSGGKVSPLRLRSYGTHFHMTSAHHTSVAGSSDQSWRLTFSDKPITLHDSSENNFCWRVKLCNCNCNCIDNTAWLIQSTWNSVGLCLFVCSSRTLRFWTK